MKRVELWDTTTAPHALGERNSVRHIGTVIVQRFRISTLFKDTNLKIAFKPHNTTQQQLTKKKNNTNPSGIYRLQCNTCKDVYIGQSGRDINTRYKEHIRYIRTNNPTSACATHILNNRHEYGNAGNTKKKQVQSTTVLLKM